MRGGGRTAPPDRLAECPVVRSDCATGHTRLLSRPAATAVRGSGGRARKAPARHTIRLLRACLGGLATGQDTLCTDLPRGVHRAPDRSVRRRVQRAS
ncbi:hypothetical protein GCM10027440_55970 [Nocardiopsis coralliicola]